MYMARQLVLDQQEIEELTALLMPKLVGVSKNRGLPLPRTESDRNFEVIL